MNLYPNQIAQLMKRFPTFELPYETNSHKKVSSEYNVALAIPSGKKVYTWFTFHEDKDVCYLFELNKERRISTAKRLPLQFEDSLSLGTILYGTLYADETNSAQYFVIEDIFYYKGIPLVKSCFHEKLCFLEKFMVSTPKKFTTGSDMLFTLPLMWEVALKDGDECPTAIPDGILKTTAYVPHHIQYRTLNVTMPYLNVYLTRKLNTVVLPSECKKMSSHKFESIPITMDFYKPQYKYPTVFQVTADIQYDIYHLFAYGKNKIPVYYNVAYVPNYKSSVFLNGLFRKIRENKNIDYIEESDDEDDFQNMNEDKYVDLNKVLLMECVFHSKFKKWVPVKVVDKYAKVVHINTLVR